MAKIFDLVSDRYMAANAIAGSNLLAGVNVQVGGLAAFTLCDVTSGDLFAAVYNADQVRALKVASSEVITAGDLLYWDNSAKKVTATQGILTVPLGYAIEGSANGDADVLMCFVGYGRTYA